MMLGQIPRYSTDPRQAACFASKHNRAKLLSDEEEVEIGQYIVEVTDASSVYNLI
jgi:hypothetical protein